MNLLVAALPSVTDIGQNITAYPGSPTVPCGNIATATMREYRLRHHAGISPPPPCGNIATAYCGNIASMIIAYCVGFASMDMYEILRRMFVLEGRQRRSRCY